MHRKIIAAGEKSPATVEWLCASCYADALLLLNSVEEIIAELSEKLDTANFILAEDLNIPIHMEYLSRLEALLKTFNQQLQAYSQKKLDSSIIELYLKMQDAFHSLERNYFKQLLQM
jgi:hypothetical protein